ncbi:DUF7543 family protein [Haloglomus salinum]|jgi:hypothetical protein|uniref:DUF7543 family protein n=1 Tax=Haloglomus salinum TaxID=2962673 RepID=UPI0020C9C63D|nr:hypothetical protein [Haloglomus salinum]
MEWHVVDGDPGDEGSSRVEWERGDRYVRVVVRETATGAWAVTLDRLAQAPEGQYYHRETVADRDGALDLAATWREENDGTASGATEDADDA